MECQNSSNIVLQDLAVQRKALILQHVSYTSFSATLHQGGRLWYAQIHFESGSGAQPIRMDLNGIPVVGIYMI